jgi:hypothetical protein
VAPLLFDGLDGCAASHGFTYTGDYVRTRTITDSYDADGTLVREVLAIHFDGTETNDSDPSRSLTVNGERNIVLDFVANTRTETGTLRHVTARGTGIVLQQTGRSVVPLDGAGDAFVAGPHQLDSGEMKAFCDALAS